MARESRENTTDSKSPALPVRHERRETLFGDTKILFTRAKELHERLHLLLGAVSELQRNEAIMMHRAGLEPATQ